MIKNFEYLVSPNFCGMQEISLLTSEFEGAFNELNARKVAKNIAQLNSELIENSGVLDAVSKRIKTHFTEVLNVSDISLAKVWMVKSQPKDTDPNKLPYLPHFDKHRYLKAMIYLHDVDIRHGPIHFSKLLSPSQIDVRRKALPANYKELGLNTIQQSDLKADMEPILGKKGDVIFFDTNAAHCGGIVSEGFERRVIRFDFDVPSFNLNSSLLRRFFNRVRSRIG
tara:strand:- start:170 stop:844 length:675 start_codon:yes stop_codon:yes gene_type:complete